jgi:hypothetical protein
VVCYRRSVRALPRIALLAAATIAAGCGERVVVRGPPWAPDAQLVVIVLDAMGRPVEALPRLHRGDAKIELTIPVGEERELVVYEHSATAKAADGISRIVDCGATFVAGGSVLAAPVHQYRSGRLDVDDAESFALAISDAPLIPIHQLECNVDPCAKLDTDDVPVMGSVPLTAVAAIADREAVVATPTDNELGDVVLFHVVDRVVTTIPTAPIPGYPRDLIYDGAGTIIGTADRGERPIGSLFAIDLAGRPVTIPDLQLGLDNKKIARGADGAIFAGGQTGLWELTVGSTIATRLDTLPTDVDSLALSARDRLVVVDRLRTIWFYDGTNWRDEWSPLVTEAAQILDVAIDEAHAVAVGTVGTILERDEATSSWARVEGPPASEGAAMIAVALLSQGRYVVAFDGGGLAIWNGQAWCETLEPLGKARIARLDTSPTRAQVFGVSNVQPVLGPIVQIVEVTGP